MRHNSRGKSARAISPTSPAQPLPTTKAHPDPTHTTPPSVSPTSLLNSTGSPTLPTKPAKLSIVDFLTDGSLLNLCAELSNLTGLRVELLDPQGRIVRRNTAADAASAWSLLDAAEFRALGVTEIPLRLAGEALGSIAIQQGEPSMHADARERIDSVLHLLAQTAAELCEQQVELRARVKEVGALARLAALLTRADSPQRVLDVVLDQALDLLEMHAGSIMLLKERSDGSLSESEEDLVKATSRNLSQDWLSFPRPLSKDRLFDKLAMSGQIVVSEDIATDPRILIPDRAREENLGAALHAGLVFKNRPLGVIRLYSREPRTFDESETKLLASLASQAAASLEQSRLLSLEQEEQALQRQLALAADVQRRMLPRGVPNYPKLDVAARYIPSYELGGDFYDFIDLNGHLGVCVGDVSGKGIAAALLMASVRSSLRAYAQDVYDLDVIVGRVNTAMCRDTREHEFASLWYGVVDQHKMRLTYCSAGHEPPIVVRVPKHRTPTLADLDELSVGGMVVGIDPSQRYQRAVFDIKPGDMILAYTDGLTDATNFAGERFGKVRVRDTLLRTLQEKPHASAGDVVERMLWEIRQFAGLSKVRSDDKTVLAVRIRE